MLTLSIELLTHYFITGNIGMSRGFYRSCIAVWALRPARFGIVNQRGAEIGLVALVRFLGNGFRCIVSERQSGLDGATDPLAFLGAPIAILDGDAGIGDRPEACSAPRDLRPDDPLRTTDASTCCFSLCAGSLLLSV
jgi:hypothetical protein